MARHETAFATDDPVLIAIGDLYRKSVVESWTVDNLLDKLQAILAPLTAPVQGKPMDRPADKMIVSSTPTIAVNPFPDPLTVAAAFGEPTYNDVDLSWEGHEYN